ncbi:hypothetical protein [Streptomyces tropicalis]|uniref:Uncharacterized protein n=1 Tax=Streptomyces tropicalis TaxID=3034234 RepID=A0ABT6AAP3_9ACTN|nr:hypothetical protein [Streptomyces tropicalis]MDF3301726.1 hypothetical protein [Streptomyces tropicalis]
MRRRRRLPYSAESHLAAHLRATVWGPAEFVGLPPRWLVVEGMLAGVAATSAIIGTAVVGALTGVPVLADGEAGLVCAAALGLYLSVVGAGRALVGVAALLGACLALQAPQAAAGVVLAERGQVRSVVVMSVEAPRAAGGGDHARYLCSVADRDGVLLGVRIWRGCDGSTRPGDALAVVLDPLGRVPPRGATPGPGPMRGPTPWGVALVGATVTAVVRSYRISSHP